MADEYYEYTTIQGDTFDAISLDFYDSEKYSYVIMQANATYIRTLIFSAGIKLKIPIIEEQSVETLPPWKKGG